MSDKKYQVEGKLIDEEWEFIGPVYPSRESAELAVGLWMNVAATTTMFRVSEAPSEN